MNSEASVHLWRNCFNCFFNGNERRFCYQVEAVATEAGLVYARHAAFIAGRKVNVVRYGIVQQLRWSNAEGKYQQQHPAKNHSYVNGRPQV